MHALACTCMHVSLYAYAQEKINADTAQSVAMACRCKVARLAGPDVDIEESEDNDWLSWNSTEDMQSTEDEFWGKKNEAIDLASSIHRPLHLAVNMKLAWQLKVDGLKYCATLVLGSPPYRSTPASDVLYPLVLLFDLKITVQM